MHTIFLSHFLCQSGCNLQTIIYSLLVAVRTSTTTNQHPRYVFLYDSSSLLSSLILSTTPAKVGTDGLDKPHFYCPPVVLAENAPIIAFPCDGAGRICILNLTELEENKTDTSAPHQCLHIFGTTSHSQDQHNKPVTGLSISADGKKLASVSDQGRTVFLSDISNLSAVNSTKFERGREAATVYSLILSEDASTIAIATSRGTVHVYTTKFISTKSSEIKPFGSQQVPLHFIKFGTSSSSVETSPLPQIELITYDGTLRTYTFQYNKSPTSAQLWEAQPPIKLLQ